MGRFSRAEVQLLGDVLDLPEWVIVDNGVKEHRVTAFAMLLRRLAYPVRLSDLELTFGWERSRFSRISNATADLIYHRWHHLLRFDADCLTPAKLKQYAEAISAKGAPAKIVWGFIDGTLRKTARPVRNQHIIYNGWKRIHSLKWHSILTPDGLHSHIFGPVEGRRHDEMLYKLSGLTEILEQHSWDPDGNALAIYGDPAYGLSRHLLSPFKGSSLSPEEQQWNAKMSNVHEAVEWSFGDAVCQFAFLDFSKNLKVLLQPVGVLYTVALLLCNAHTILHHPQIPQYFSCPPPTLHEYFHGNVPVPTPDNDVSSLESLTPWGFETVPEDEEEPDNDDSDVIYIYIIYKPQVCCHLRASAILVSSINSALCCCSDPR